MSQAFCFNKFVIYDVTNYIFMKIYVKMFLS